MTSILSNPGHVPVRGNGAVLAELHDQVLLVTINRPEVRNAVNVDVAQGVGDALEFAEREPEVRAVIITGSGALSFCAGQDLKEAAEGISLTDPAERRWGFAGFVRHAISTPTIAAVNGYALGGGTEIVLASDLAVAADTATFGVPEVKRGILPGAGGAFRLARQIPQKLAMEMLLTGDPIDAARACELGLVNRVVPADRLLDEAFALADAIVRNAPLSVQAAKRISREIDAGAYSGEDSDWERSAREGAMLMKSEDAREGMTAFTQKRTPTWTAR